MSSQRYQFVGQDDKAYTIAHPDGSHFQVAKNGLEKSEHAYIEKLPKFAEGGEVKKPVVNPDEHKKFLKGTGWAPKPSPSPTSAPKNYANGGMIEEPEDVIQDFAAGEQPQPPAPVNPNQQAYDERLTQRLAQKAALWGGEEQVPPQAKQEAEAEAAQDVINLNKKTEASAQASAQRTNRVDALKQQLGLTTSAPQVTEVSVDQQVSAPSAGPEVGAQAESPAMQQMQGVLDQSQQAIDTQLGAEQAKGDAQSRALSAQVTAQEAIAKNYQRHLKEFVDQDEKLFKDVSGGRIDPNHYWANKSTGDKVLATISLLLGGLGGMGHGNVGLDILNKAIEQDIDAQKANLNQKNNLFKLNMERFHNEQAATLAAQAQLTALTAAKMNLAAAQAQSPEAKARALAAGAQLGQQAINFRSQLAMFAARQAITGGTVGDISSYIESLPPEEAKGFRERLVRLPSGKEALAYSPDSAKEVTKKVTAFKNLTSLLDRMDKVGPSALLKFGKAADQAAALQSSLVTEIKNLEGLGALSATDAELARDRITDPTSFRQMLGGKSRSDSFRQTLDGMIESVLSASVQGHKAPKKVGTPYKGAK